MKHCTYVGSLGRSDILLVISAAQECQRYTVGAQRRLDDIRKILPVLHIVKISHILAGHFLMSSQVIICSVRDAPKLAPAEREQELQVRGRLAVERKLFLLMIPGTHFIVLHAEGLQPVDAVLFPVCEPLQISIRLTEELELHLLELTRTECEVAGRDLISEGFADLGNAERHFLSGSSLDILEVYENTLRSLGTQINGILCVFRDALECLEHQVELTDVGKIMLAAGRAGDLMVPDEIHHFLRLPAIHGAFQLDAFLSREIFDQFVGTETLVAAAAVHQRIGKASKMSAGDPCLRVHKDGAVHAYVIGILLHEFLPPSAFYIILELHAQIAVIPCICKPAVNLGTGINKTSGLGQRYDLFHCLFHSLLPLALRYFLI